MKTRDRILASGYRLAVLSGGSSSEREVSLVSGRAVAEAAAGLGLPCDLFELADNALPQGLSADRHLVLPVVHGSYGEDGRLSADLDRGGFAYGGCGLAASAICFDKLATKAIAAYAGIPVAADRFLPRGAEADYTALERELGHPFILKPRRDGSSVGLHLVRDEAGFAAAAADLARWDYLAESYIEGCDLTVGVLGGAALGVVGVHPEGGLYDYRHKYTSGLSRYEVPARIPEDMAAQLRHWTEIVFDACGCRDIGRVDFRLGHGGDAVFLEINTLPGMTATSLLPKAAQCAGLSFGDLVLEWARFALERREARA